LIIYFGEGEKDIFQEFLFDKSYIIKIDKLSIGWPRKSYGR